MKIFLDTANIADIQKYISWGTVDGITTNPSIIAKEGVALKDRIQEIQKMVAGPISAEVIATEHGEMLKEAREVATWGDNIFVKLPTTPDGLKTLKILSQEGIKTNMTLVFSVTQALLVAKNGATLVSPFLGRLDDIGESGIQLLDDIVQAYNYYGYETQVLAASIRNVGHVQECLKKGADIVTLPPKILDAMIQHDLTDTGLEKFLADWEKVKDLQK